MLSETDTSQEIVVETKDEKKSKPALPLVSPRGITGHPFRVGCATQAGLLIDLNIYRTGMFSQTASWADLGIADIEDKRST